MFKSTMSIISKYRICQKWHSFVALLRTENYNNRRKCWEINKTKLL